MACMEHACTNWDCNHAVFNNLPTVPDICPKCGTRMQHFSDDMPELEYEPDGDWENDEC